VGSGGVGSGDVGSGGVGSGVGSGANMGMGTCAICFVVKVPFTKLGCVHDEIFCRECLIKHVAAVAVLNAARPDDELRPRPSCPLCRQPMSDAVVSDITTFTDAEAEEGLGGRVGTAPHGETDSDDDGGDGVCHMAFPRDVHVGRVLARIGMLRPMGVLPEDELSPAPPKATTRAEETYLHKQLAALPSKHETLALLLRLHVLVAVVDGFCVTDRKALRCELCPAQPHCVHGSLLYGGRHRAVRYETSEEHRERLGPVAGGRRRIFPF